MGDEVAERLATYAELVRRWATRLDLVSPGDLDGFEERHIQDSLRLLPLADELPDGAAIDVGSGAGLPGIPLTIAGGGRWWRLLEPRRGRAGFLEECVRVLDLPCEVVPLRAQEAASDPFLREGHVLVTARALATPAKAFPLLLPLVARAGVAAVITGPGAILPTGAEELSPGVAIIRDMRPAISLRDEN